MGVIAWFSLHPEAVNLSAPFEISVTCLVVVAAILSAGFVAGRWRVESVRRIDWIGVVALLAGLETPLYMSYWSIGAGAESWWHPWLLPAYGVGFLVCLFGRIAQRIRTVTRFDEGPQ